MDNLIHFISPNDIFRDKRRTKRRIKKEPKEYNTNEGIKGDDKIWDIIDNKYWDNYETWTKIIWAMKNEGYSEKTARDYSMKSSKYDADGFMHFWDKAPLNINITQGTINHYAKLSDKDKYYDTIQQQNSEKFDIHRYVSIQSQLHSEELKK